jgi:micrococcal nuclease
MDNYIRNAKVVRVVDADTIDILIDLGLSIYKQERVRLARVNAWETRGESRDMGMIAKAFVERILPPGSTVTVRTVKDKEKYGRYLAEVEFEAEGAVVNLGDLLLAEGYAKLYGK